MQFRARRCRGAESDSADRRGWPDQLNQRVACTVAADGLARHGDTPFRAEGDEGLEVDQLAQIRRGLWGCARRAPDSSAYPDRRRCGCAARADGRRRRYPARFHCPRRAGGRPPAPAALTRCRGVRESTSAISRSSTMPAAISALCIVPESAEEIRMAHHAVACVLRGFKPAQKGVRRGLEVFGF